MVKDDSKEEIRNTTKDDSYEIMPYREIVELKKQIAELQVKTGDTSSKDLLNSISTLTKSINSLLGLFSSAAEQMKLDDKTEAELSEKVAPLLEKINRLEKQNETIAEGIVAVADMIKEIKKPKEGDEKIGRQMQQIPKQESFAAIEEQSFLEPKPFEAPQSPQFLHSETPRVVLRKPQIPPQWQTSSPIPPPPPFPPLSSKSLSPFPRKPQSLNQELPPLPPLPPFEEKPKKGFFGISKK